VSAASSGCWWRWTTPANARTEPVAQGTVSHRPNPGVISRTLGARSGGVARDMERRGRNVQARARQLVGVDTGHLRSRIFVQLIPARGGPGWAARIYVDDVAYAKFHHDGNYHRQGRWIRPVRARALRLRFGSRVVFAAKVRSFGGNPFLQRALPAGRR
jgi:hypothetical protein